MRTDDFDYNLPDELIAHHGRLSNSQVKGGAMRTDDFDYNLPDELIAQAPAEPRDSCRLLVVNRELPGGPVRAADAVALEHGGSVEHRHFYDIVDYLEPGDLLVANQTRVMPARLIGKKPTGGVAETLLLRRREDVDPLGHVWECLVNPAARTSIPSGMCGSAW